MSEFLNAINDLVKEKNIPKDSILDAIKAALEAAYHKNYKSEAKNIRVEIDENSGDFEVYRQKTVVEEVLDDSCEVSLEDALNIDPRYQINDIIEYMETPEGFGRVAAQAAKQVVIQKLRETEQEMVYDNFISKQGELITGRVQRISNQTVFVNIGSTDGILVASERTASERYKVNDRIKAYIYEVRKSNKGPQVFLSRTHPNFIKKLFELEVPEIEDGDVVIKSIAREAGSRTKIAVFTEDEDIDPVGACVGQNGSRVRNIVDELWGEKIDITTWSDDPAVLISNVLSPAKVEEVIIDDDEMAATVVVPDYQLSLAIGKEGQNVRLAARLCGWKIDIKSHTQYFGEEGEFDEDEYYDDEEYIEDEIEEIEADEDDTDDEVAEEVQESETEPAEENEAEVEDEATNEETETTEGDSVEDENEGNEESEEE